MDPAPGDLIKRHSLATRLWHWLNAVAVYVLFTSGLGIFNAHPRLYWGEYGANYDTPWLRLARFPEWLTLPGYYSLAMSRRWHLAFALILAFALLAFMIASLANRHVQRDLKLGVSDIAPRRIWSDISDHLHLRFHGPGYNILQKASYVGVIFLVLPLLIGTGLTLSPGIDAAWPWLLDLFGGRQSARSIHFIAAWALVAFVAVHLVMVVLSGPLNGIRSMITGRYRLPRDNAGDRP